MSQEYEIHVLKQEGIRPLIYYIEIDVDEILSKVNESD